MKILFITHHIKGNDGWSRYARDLAMALKKEGMDVLCLVHEITSETGIPQVMGLGDPLSFVGNPWRSYRASRLVNKVITEYSPDVIHFIVEPYGTIIPFLRRGKAKMVLTAHSTYAFIPILLSGLRRMISTYITRLTYSRIDLIVCVSRYTEKHLRYHMDKIHSLQVVAEKITVMAGGVNVHPYIVDKIVSGKHIPKEILFVGALKSRKGIKEALAALALVKTDFIYRIVGYYNPNDSYVKMLLDKIGEYKLKDKIILSGEVSDDDLRKMYRNADLFLMLSTNNGSDFEGYGLVYLEANLYGVPCVGPNDSGVSDAIVDGKTGYLVDQFNPVAVAEKIEYVLNNQPINPSDCIAWANANSTETKGKAMASAYNKLITP